jgi:hypothetical protein
VSEILRAATIWLPWNLCPQICDKDHTNDRLLFNIEEQTGICTRIPRLSCCTNCFRQENDAVSQSTPGNDEQLLPNLEMKCHHRLEVSRAGRDSNFLVSSAPLKSSALETSIPIKRSRMQISEFGMWCVEFSIAHADP